MGKRNSNFNLCLAVWAVIDALVEVEKNNKLLDGKDREEKKAILGSCELEIRLGYRKEN